MNQHIVTAILVVCSAAWIGHRIWGWARKRRSKAGGTCGGCSKCGNG